MDGMSFVRLVRAFTTAVSRRDLARLALPAALVAGLADLFGLQERSSAVESQSDPGSSHRRRRRRTRHHHRNGQHSHHRPGQQQRQKTCSKSGEIPHKGKACCKGLIRDGAGTCAVANTTCDVCASGCRYASLQDAVDAAAAGDTIRLCAGTFSGAEIDVDVDVEGNGGDTIVTRRSTSITAAEATGRVIRVLPERRVVLRDLQITGGVADLGISAAAARGGGIENAGNLRLTRVAVTDNEAIDLGGGIYNGVAAVLTLESSAVRRNRTRSVNGDGAGIYNDSNGQVILTDSIIELNTAGRNGGGIYTAPGGVVTLTATRVTTNTAGGGGGGIFNDGGTVTGVNPADVHGNMPTDCSGNAVDGCPAPP
jgi:hypothetical protein